MSTVNIGPDGSQLNPYLGWTEAKIVEQIDALGAAADARRPDGLSSISSLGGASIDYMTSKECTQLHLLKMALPTFSQLRQDASERIKSRISERRTRRPSDPAKGI